MKTKRMYVDIELSKIISNVSDELGVTKQEGSRYLAKHLKQSDTLNKQLNTPTRGKKFDFRF